MRTPRLLALLVTATLGLTLGAGDLLATPPKNKKAKDTAKPAALETTLPIEPSAFGSDSKSVIATYEKLIEKDYQAEFDKVEPGVEMRRLEEKMQADKDYMRKSLLVLDTPPTTLDGTKLVGEFTYGNQESILRVERGGKKRTMFFIRDRLWKYIDSYALGEKSKWGATFAVAAKKLEEKLGVPGRELAANPAEGRRFAELDWADEYTHVRAIDWGKEFAVAFVERATEGRLDELRKNKEKPAESVDPTVKGVLRK